MNFTARQTSAFASASVAKETSATLPPTRLHRSAVRTLVASVGVLFLLVGSEGLLQPPSRRNTSFLSITILWDV